MIVRNDKRKMDVMEVNTFLRKELTNHIMIQSFYFKHISELTYLIKQIEFKYLISDLENVYIEVNDSDLFKCVPLILADSLGIEKDSEIEYEMENIYLTDSINYVKYVNDVLHKNILEKTQLMESYIFKILNNKISYGIHIFCNILDTQFYLQ
jgi:hypothetical protein